ncbi:hypothetical protein FRUB_00305 [Fimbriiglobus ruber]|uniref:Uncharacterized protein n=1 Tax=Fimbriiglobus ruber TaxID=1908690 RepID=A0A225E967_9BACT|nr:hypothetical protein FRUB_00305 [Fimbriiglobus ruber]
MTATHNHTEKIQYGKSAVVTFTDETGTVTHEVDTFGTVSHTVLDGISDYRFELKSTGAPRPVTPRRSLSDPAFVICSESAFASCSDPAFVSRSDK